MSLYKLIEVKKTEEKETQSIYDKNNFDSAITDMHNDFGVMVKSSDTIGCIATLIDNTTGKNISSLQWGESVKDRVYTHNDYANDNISAYDSEQLAIGNYHTKIASQRNKAECNFALTVRLDGKGEFADFNAWTRPVAPVEE